MNWKTEVCNYMLQTQCFYLFPTPALSGSGSTGLISGIVFRQKPKQATTPVRYVN